MAFLPFALQPNPCNLENEGMEEWIPNFSLCKSFRIDYMSCNSLESCFFLMSYPFIPHPPVRLAPGYSRGGQRLLPSKFRVGAPQEVCKITKRGLQKKILGYVEFRASKAKDPFLGVPMGVYREIVGSAFGPPIFGKLPLAIPARKPLMLRFSTYPPYGLPNKLGPLLEEDISVGKCLANEGDLYSLIVQGTLS